MHSKHARDRLRTHPWPDASDYCTLLFFHTSRAYRPMHACDVVTVGAQENVYAGLDYLNSEDDGLSVLTAGSRSTAFVPPAGLVDLFSPHMLPWVCRELDAQIRQSASLTPRFLFH